MLIFKKSSGYPMTLIFESSDVNEDEDWRMINEKDANLETEDRPVSNPEMINEDEDWKGYVSVVFDENHEKISEFFHNELRDRSLWAKGFYEGLEYKNKL